MQCRNVSAANAPTWGFVDLALWKLVPEKLHGGRLYIQRFKDAWLIHNKSDIKRSALRHKLPVELLAGVCWIEVGGDPSIIDRIALEIRTLDWSGPSWIDKYLTTTKEPAKTSFGAVSIQLRVAAETLGIDIQQLSNDQLRNLASCLQKDSINIQIVARHLLDLVVYDRFERLLPALTPEQIRIVGARYNRGTAHSLEQLKKNTSYGDFIVKNWPRFQRLMR